MLERYERSRSERENGMILVYTTCPDTKEAMRLGARLLNEKLASAINFWPLQIMVRSGAGVENRLGAGVLIKTMEPRFADIESVIEESSSDEHPYAGAIDIRRFNRPYREWMTTVVRE
ncbi:divalent cation tolerance protein CutA [Candidatus Uhrbacteria bacterium]|nr:divalent cation tolerance protein CutA [Candidatus Uhrbacteria bacterium]